MQRLFSRSKSPARKRVRKAKARTLQNYMLKALVGLYRVRLMILFVVLVGLISIGGMYAFDSIHNRILDTHTISDKVILDRIEKHISLPDADPLSLKRVEDAGSLREQNEFYHSVKEGDYILAYDTMLIIYDVVNDRIVAVKTKGK